MRGSPEYRAWQGAKNRCNNKNVQGFGNYGGRGIKFHEGWVGNFQAFFEAVGPRPSDKHSLDRIDTNGHYEPGNVRWATAREQAANRRNNTYIVIRGERMRFEDAAERFGVEYQTARSRIRRGLSVEQAFTPMTKLECHAILKRMRESRGDIRIRKPLPPSRLAKFTRRQVDRIIQRFSTGKISMTKLAGEYGVSHRTIGRMIDGQVKAYRR